MGENDIDIIRQIEIIHLSDIHFGDSHQFNIPKTTEGDVPDEEGYPSLAEKLLKDLGEINNDVPVLVCITGDIVNTASRNEYIEAEKFINDLLKSEQLKELTTDNFLIVPGNHDYDYNLEGSGMRSQEYLTFYNRIFNTNIRRENVEELKIVHDFSEQGYIVACINSALHGKKGTPDAKRGRLTTKTLEQLTRELEEIPEDKLTNSIRIGLVHHHPVLIPSLAEKDRGYDAIHNSEKLILLLKKFGFHAILHGHKHNPHSFTEDIIPAYKKNMDHPMLIVAGGSVGSTELPENSYCTNSYNKITIKWHPKGNQSRIRVETRGLETTDQDGNELLATRWEWNLMNIDDRHFYTQNNTPVVSSNCNFREFAVEDEQNNKIRIEEYTNSRGNQPVVNVLPSLVPKQAYDAIFWVVQHPYGKAKNNNEKPARVIYSAGDKFPVVEVIREENPDYIAKFTYWGPMLIQVKMIFDDGHEYISNVYARIPNHY